MAGPSMSPAQFARELRQLENGQRFTADLRKSYRRIGTKAAGWARDEMRSSGDRQLARSAGAVRGSASAASARISVGGASVPGALAAVWGTKGPTGWYAGWYKGQIDPERRVGFMRGVISPNNPRWIGNTWTVATRGQGPRGINDALADHQPEIQAEVVTEMDRMMARAFPVGRL